MLWANGFKTFFWFLFAVWMWKEWANSGLSLLCRAPVRLWRSNMSSVIMWIIKLADFWNDGIVKISHWDIGLSKLFGCQFSHLYKMSVKRTDKEDCFWRSTIWYFPLHPNESLFWGYELSSLWLCWSDLTYFWPITWEYFVSWIISSRSPVSKGKY